VAEKWSERDPRAVAEWLGQMPQGKDRDIIMREYVGKAVYIDPPAAAAWVQQAADLAIRQQAAGRVFVNVELGGPRCSTSVACSN
jgi:hypothetical protein